MPHPLAVPGREPLPLRPPSEILTPRQTAVLAHLAAGYPNRETATRLCCSRRTVEKHREALLDRLGLHNTPAAIRYALRWGLVREDVPWIT